tara:strand:- start:3508 stop:3834 length:327 start_codon:yes stop_codon:yes gene_type:complete
MKIVNEMDKQMKRFQKAIADQIEVADAYRESERTISGLRYSLELANKKRSASEPDPLAPPPPDIEGDYVDSDIIDLEIPDFSSPKPNRISSICNCVGLCIYDHNETKG